MAVRTRRRIDINTAGAEAIQRACGIDGVLAERIVRYRQQRGPFSTREDLDAVPGFAEIRTDEVLSVVNLPSRHTTRRTTRRSDYSTRGGRARAGSRSAETTTDHKFIQRWVEERGGWPACVKGTGRGRSDVGMIRIDFPGFSGEDSLQRIDWDDWFKQFDDNELAFLYRDFRHSDGDLDRFNKLVKR